ncbi:MAG TPA: NADH-quinone oxidoreductase subunit A [Cyclobacteriaceae bacterium]|nr:NADH-quinone oxidoreductase subunit A [Cyclobacteriaceae bacterium]
MNEQELYLSEFAQILLFIVASILFVMGGLITSRIIRPNRPNPEKLSTYESGEETVGNAWAQFNIRFYIIALIFILFEIELVLLFPWATVFARKELIEATNGTWGWLAFAEMFVFVGILIIGLAYAWVNGFLDWIKPQPKPRQLKSVVPKEMYEKINQKYN